MSLLNTNPHYANARCRTTVRHRLRPWFFILIADMRWQPRVTWFWQSLVDSLNYGSVLICRTITGPPVVEKMDYNIFQRNRGHRHAKQHKPLRYPYGSTTTFHSMVF